MQSSFPFDQINNDPRLQALWNDPDVVIYTKDQHFGLVENDRVLSKTFPRAERFLYPFTSRVISDICQSSYHNEDPDSIRLECHNQASFARHDQERDKETDTERIPDGAVFAFNRKTGELILLFWVEAKRLVSPDWDHALAISEAIETVQTSIPQLREQAAHAFRYYPNISGTYNAFLQAGPFWTHFEFSQGMELMATSMINKYVAQGSTTIDTQEDDSRPRKRAKKEPLKRTAFDLVFPKVTFCNVRIVDSERKEYNPLFLKVINDVLSENGFSFQPCWLTPSKRSPQDEKRFHGPVPVTASTVKGILRDAYMKQVEVGIGRALKDAEGRDTSGAYHGRSTRAPSGSSERPDHPRTRSRSRDSENSDTEAPDGEAPGAGTSESEGLGDFPPASVFEGSSDEASGSGTEDDEDETDDN